MKIEIVSEGPWIVKMYKDGEELDYEKAIEMYNYIVTELNTTQYE